VPSDPVTVREASFVTLLLGKQEWRLAKLEVFKAGLAEFYCTFLYEFVHLSIVQSTQHQEFKSWAPAPLVAAVQHGIMIALLIFSFAASSGAHFNPNVTITTVMLGRTTVFRAIVYIFAQLLGAILGAVAMRFVVGWDEFTNASLARCTVGDLTNEQSIVANMVLYMFLFGILGGIAFDPRNSETFGPVLAPIFISVTVALLIFSSSKISSGFGGPLLNLAECLGVSIATGESNSADWVSFVGPLIGGVAYAMFFFLTTPPACDSDPEAAICNESPLLEPLFQKEEQEKESEETSFEACDPSSTETRPETELEEAPSNTSVVPVLSC